VLHNDGLLYVNFIAYFKEFLLCGEYLAVYTQPCPLVQSAPSNEPNWNKMIIAWQNVVVLPHCIALIGVFIDSSKRIKACEWF
jgi:hypothetical protein